MFVNLGLIGQPLKHSLSPFIQTRFLKNTNINGGFSCFETDGGEELQSTIKMLSKYSFRGINVTVPHKEEVMEHLDDIDETAKTIGAVNTVLFSDKIRGFNTDAHGFEQMLIRGGCPLEGKKVLLLGSGGSAKAVLYILKKAGVDLTLVNRSMERAEQTLKSMNFDNATLEDYTFIKKDVSFDYVVNATSIGLETGEFIDMSRVSCQAAVDLQYKLTETPFLRGMSCEKKIDGFSMLVYQAAKAFQIWTGVYPEFSVDDIFSEVKLKR